MKLPDPSAGKTLKEDLHRIEAAILYLLASAQELSQYDIVKSLFLADRAHMNKYGRPITFDNYVAMEHGPVPSMAYDALKPEYAYRQRFGHERPWTSIPDPANPKANRFTALRKPRLEYLSETDREELDAALAMVRSLTFPQLRRLTHEDPAYVEAWERRGAKASAPIRLALLIEEDGEELASDLSYVSFHA